MSDFEKLACAIAPPMEDSINVLAVTTSASSAQDSGVSAGSPRYVTFIADVACFITFSNDGLNSAITDPDGTATSNSGRTWRLAADQPQAFLITRTARYFKARGSDAGFLRWYISSL